MGGASSAPGRHGAAWGLAFGGSPLSPEATEAKLNAMGLELDDVFGLATHFARRLAPLRLRDDARAAFLLGALKAVPKVDLARPDAKPLSYLVAYGLGQLWYLLRRERHARPPGVCRLDYSRPDSDLKALVTRLPDTRTVPPDELAADADLRAAVRRAVASLPAKERAAVQALDLDGLTAEEAAKRCGVTRQALYLRRARALERLRCKLRQLKPAR